MNQIRKVLDFGRIYLRRYWGRLIAGILMGVLFGMSNASFVWATRTLTDRLTPESKALTNRLERLSPDLVAADKKGKLPSPFSPHLNKLKQRVDRAIDPWLPKQGVRLDWKMFLGGLLFLPLLVTVRSVTDYLSNYCMGWVSERVVNDLRIDVPTKLSTLSLDFFNRSTTGDMLTRITGDTANLQRALRIGSADLIKESMTVLCVLAVLCWIDWKLTLFAMIFLPLCFFPLIVLGKKARRATRASLNANIAQSSQLVELISSIRVVKAFCLEELQLTRFRKSSRELVHHGMKGIQAKELINPIIEV